MSSTGSKIFFGVSVVVSIGVIGFVHYSQKRDRLRMREGILRDIERREQNIKELEYQKKLESALRQQLSEGFSILKNFFFWISWLIPTVTLIGPRP